MNIITNESLIRRNARIANIAMISGLAVLGTGMFVSFRFTDARYFYLSLLALVGGFILSQIGIYFSNHFGRSPRPDELVSQALKGLDGKYTLYHYMTPVPHLLVGPSGLWLILPRRQRGRISYVRERWKQSGGSLYMRLFAQEGLGRPDLDIAAQQDKLSQYLKEKLPGGTPVPEINAALVFTHPNVSIDIPEDADPPAETVLLAKLKETIRKSAKSHSFSPEKVQQITALFPAESK